MLSAATSGAHAQAPGKLDGEVAEAAVRLIGGPVYADGRVVGELSDVLVTDDGRVERIRVSTSARLGFGPRTIEIPKGGFEILDRAVILEFPAAALDDLPNAVTEADVNENK